MTRGELALCITTFLGASSSQAQVSLEWARTYSGGPFRVDVALALAFDSSGNVIITGGSENTRGYRDITTIKYTSSGNQLWVSRFNEVQNADMIGYNLAVDATGNVYVAGGVFMKLNPQGDTVWIKRISGTFSGMRFINIDSFGNPVVTGVRINDYQTKKYSSSGNELWARYLNGPANENDMPYAQHLDKQGNVVVTGRLANSIPGQTDYIIGTAKYTSAGDTAWLRYYQGPTYYDAGYGITSDDTGNVYVTGESDDSSGFPELILLKYSPTGETRWTTRYRRTSIGDVGYEVAVDGSGNIYVAGVTGSSNFMLVKFNAQGTAQWSRVYAEYPFAIPLPNLALDTSGYVYVCGHQRRGSWSDYRIAKYDGDGTQLWSVDYPQSGTGYNEPYDMKIDRSGNIYITGGGANDYLTLKYRQDPVSVETSTSDLPLSFALYQNYPNPLNPTTTIKFSVGTYGHTSLRVFDLLGREVAMLVNEGKAPGEYEMQFDAGGLSSGVYFYRLQAAGFVETKKLILIR